MAREPTQMITGIQIKAARALLGISARQLAAMADVFEATIIGLEGGRERGSRLTFFKLRRALELNGVEFLEGLPGVRLKGTSPTSDEAALPDIPDDTEPYDGAPV